MTPSGSVVPALEHRDLRRAGEGGTQRVGLSAGLGWSQKRGPSCSRQPWPLRNGNCSWPRGRGTRPAGSGDPDEEGETFPTVLSPALVSPDLALPASPTWAIWKTLSGFQKDVPPVTEPSVNWFLGLKLWSPTTMSLPPSRPENTQPRSPHLQNSFIRKPGREDLGTEVFGLLWGQKWGSETQVVVLRNRYYK